jgi:hypothetical protein
MEGGHIMVIALTAIGCGTAVITTFIDKAFGGKSKALQQEVRAEKDRARMLEAQVVEAHRQNDVLQKQLEWHTKMLETQDRLMKQLTDGKPQSHSESSVVSRS